MLICWGMGALGYQQFGVIGVLLLIPFYMLLTLGVQKFVLDKLSATRKPKKQTRITKKQIVLPKT